jgi:Zn-dependent protease
VQSFEMVRTGTLFFLALVVALSVHEAAHAAMALLLGDSTAQEEGRLSLNPLRHMDPLGSLMLLWMAFQGVGVGWARPVPVNPLRLRWLRSGMGLVAFAGPLSNMLQAFLASRLLLVIPVTDVGTGLQLVGDFCFVFAYVNVALALFNLLPVYPLDGLKVFSALLPGYWGRRLDFFALKFGMWPLVLLLLWEWLLPFPGVFQLFFSPVSRWVCRLMQIVP